MNWSDDMDRTLIAGWEAGLSSSEIAALVGGVTATAVRCHRLDLGLPDRTNTALVYAGRHKAGYQPPRRQAAPKIRGKLAPQSNPKPFADREPNECAFPLGDGLAMRACCAPIRRGQRRPYCDYHLSLTEVARASA